MSHTSRSSQLAIGHSGDGGRHHRVVLVHPDLHAQPVVVGDRVEMVDDLEARAVLAPGKLR